MAILAESCKVEWRDMKVDCKLDSKSKKSRWPVHVYYCFQINHEHVCDAELNVAVPDCSCLIKKDCNIRKVI
jgi:hypothetical protein